ncbi:MAG TPA: SIMPL domain-containing protein [Xanthobacteraceae bacterium]|jgi:uncharacterized protein YggE|nr:SIMPL domain-containing protein [Xanthobacteraceae bacterium]
MMAEAKFSQIVATRLVLATLASAAAFACLVPSVEAQTPQAQPAPFVGIVVVGEGRVTVAPDYAQIASGVSTRGKTVKEASDANSKTMAAIIKALLESGVTQNDVQTSRFSVQPVYVPPAPNTEPKLAGYSVSNQLRAKIRQIDKLGEILDRLIAAGATDVGNIAFLVSDPSKALDQAREAAIADARRKAEVYARAAGIRLGQVEWITEASGFGPVPLRGQGASAARAAVPIATGDDTLEVTVTVGFTIAP